jgi:hypothetical protein
MRLKSLLTIIGALHDIFNYWTASLNKHFADTGLYITFGLIYNLRSVTLAGTNVIPNVFVDSLTSHSLSLNLKHIRLRRNYFQLPKVTVFRIQKVRLYDFGYIELMV